MIPMNDLPTKDRILQTAVSLFSSRGLNGVSVADIAETAKVNKALIFYYYGSKDKLYLEVFKNRLKAYRSTLEKAFDEKKPGIAVIETFVRNQMAFIEENVEMFRLFLRELLKSQDDGDSYPPILAEMAETMKPLRDKVLVNLTLARKRGEIRDIDPIQTMVNIIGMNIFFFLGKPIIQLLNPSLDTEDFQKHRVEHVIDLLMNGLRKRPEQEQ